MNATDKWVRQFNNYGSLDTKASLKTIYHYTKSENLKNILREKCFWATKIQEFNDPNEGIASLKELNLRISNIPGLDDSVREEFCKFTESENAIKKYIQKFPGYVISFSVDSNSQYMKEEFNSNDKSNGRDCLIVIDTGTFLNTSYLSIDGKKCTQLIKGHKIIYNDEEQ